MFIWSRICCAGLLGSLSILDIRRKKLPGIVLLAGAVLAIFCQIFQRAVPPVLSLLGILVGISFLGISKVTREALGYGDSILVLILGIYLGFWSLLCLLMTAFMLAAGYSMIVLAKKGFRRKMTIPFVPFLGIAYVLILAAGV